ncbi:hypothetical protein BH20ACT5_BH20ACT5_00680 [soil metagenome]
MDRAVLPATTRRGRDTRAGLLAAARTVFERDGYVDARITDIAVEAGVAHGTFYAHFRSKPEVFLAVMADLWSTLLLDPGATQGSPYQRVLASNRRFLAGYRRHARLFAVVEQAATTNDEVRALRRQVHADNAARVARAVARWQREGVAAADVPPQDAATALVSMVGRAAYYWYVVGEPHTADTEAETLTRLWIRGLGIAVPDQRER